ncbi:hypothetical protein BDP81DRAFT_483957 [Colletotrichum phormii]|uniref:Nephrocystin 3-like N-terminal domain-containing protein n=1 Tax=Colletotrichum phormii TaxID=359342 RepID=A0AAI9ZK71_9PEZI|nr:uncharacterized protein BDP81DRAFT_483957 [Colletotrichum phormii]KAK1624831.1 hypothetical protein BDP81DRAFT_483957 [Colletotrichum phormii]
MANPQQYTIGWICAITTEFVAAQAFLDEKHEPPQMLARNDNNTYALGRIGKHNVVMPTLPKSSYGATSAAAVARDMVHSFPNIRAPSQKHDIRLGDVVVGCPGDGEGGIVQYDYGKTIQDQNFTETGHLNQPPQSLLTAVGALEAAFALSGHHINEDIEDAFQRRIRIRKTHSLPNSFADRLYHCSTSHVVPRHERADDEDNPAIHYGIIASANQLMKDAVKRDKLSSERNVLCFEMEAAGLMNHFPCLVIRGISDYADTHKNKAWQGFAAMTAAAYAKDLLGQLIPSRVETKVLVAKVLSLDESKADIKAMVSDQQIKKIRKWLNPPDTSVNVNKAKDLRHQGTGRWIFKTQALQEWNAGSRQHLWLPGLAGCGKTVLSTTILDYLLSQADGVVLQFYFDFSDGGKQTSSQMLRGLVYQLYDIASRYTSHKRGADQPRSSDLSDCFLAMLEKYPPKVFILIDALDECTERKEILAWMRDFGSFPGLAHIKLLVTGRCEVEFQQQFPLVVGPDNCMSLHLESVDADIRSYVDAQLRVRVGFKRWASAPEVLQTISGKVGDKADGMFRWAACQLDALEECLNLEEIERALESLPRDLNDTYGRILESIPKIRKDKSILLLQFLLHSKDPLTLGKTVDLLAIRGREFNPKYRVPDPTEIPLFCPSLGDQVLVHCHWMEFNPLNASIHLTHKLLAVLMGYSEIPFHRATSKINLVGPAAGWTTYAQRAEAADDIAQAAANFLQNEDYRRFWISQTLATVFRLEVRTNFYITSGKGFCWYSFHREVGSNRRVLGVTKYQYICID